MNEMDPGQLAALRAMAEAYLRRPLSAEEIRQLEAFARHSPLAAQQEQNESAAEATVQGVMQIYGLDTASAAVGKLAQGGVSDNLTSFLALLGSFGTQR